MGREIWAKEIRRFAYGVSSESEIDFCGVDEMVNGFCGDVERMNGFSGCALFGYGGCA